MNPNTFSEGGTEMDYDPERILADVAEWEAKAAELERVAAAVTDHRFSGTSRSGFVRAEVDGDGRVLDIDVAREALRQAHPSGIGPDTVEAVAAARAAAGQASLTRVLAVLGEPR